MGGRTEQREMLGCDTVSEVAQLILEGALELGWPFEARRLGFLYPHVDQSLDIGYPGSVVTVPSTGQ